MTLSQIFKPEKFTGWHMMAVMILFFGTILAVNVALAWYANKSWTGLVVKNSYEASQQFNKTTAERKRQLAMGWQTTIDYGESIFALRITDINERTLHLQSVTAMFGRPANAAEDRSIKLIRAGESLYEGSVVLAPGIWQVDLEAKNKDGEIWRKAIRFVVKE